MKGQREKTKWAAKGEKFRELRDITTNILAATFKVLLKTLISEKLKKYNSCSSTSVPDWFLRVSDL